MNAVPMQPGWGNGMRRGASVLELGGASPSPCMNCAGTHWRYGSCASLDVPWQQAPSPCCHQHVLPPHHPSQPYRKGNFYSNSVKLGQIEKILTKNYAPNNYR